MLRLKILNLLFFSLFTVFLIVLFLVHFHSLCIYTTLLSIAISQYGVHHHLYADDTWLLNDFASPEYIRNIAILENTIAEVCSWMSANLLMLNPSKTDFLLIGFPI
jgi:hypothetical protein